MEVSGLHVHQIEFVSKSDLSTALALLTSKTCSYAPLMRYVRYHARLS